MADEYELLDLEGEDFAERAPRRPSSQSSYKPRPSAGAPSGVSQAQLEAALARVDGKIKTVADGVSTISSRVNSLAAASKKEAEERKKTVENTNKDLNSKLMMLAILPALIQPTFTLPGVQIPAGAPLTAATATSIGTSAVPAQYIAPAGQPQPLAGASIDISADPNTLNLMLPILAMAGSATGTPGDSSASSDTNMMMMLALVLALGVR